MQFGDCFNIRAWLSYALIMNIVYYSNYSLVYYVVACKLVIRISILLVLEVQEQEVCLVS